MTPDVLALVTMQSTMAVIAAEELEMARPEITTATGAATVAVVGPVAVVTSLRASSGSAAVSAITLGDMTMFATRSPMMWECSDAWHGIGST